MSHSLSRNQRSSCIVLVVHFNPPSVTWSDNFYELIGDNVMEEFTRGPTHRDGNELDLLLLL